VKEIDEAITALIKMNAILSDMLKKCPSWQQDEILNVKGKCVLTQTLLRELKVEKLYPSVSEKAGHLR
jgi:hypothetical protein